jgi:hypothetical protein
VATVLAGVRIEDDDPPIHIAVGDVDLVALRVHLDGGRAAEQPRVVAAAGLPADADLQHEPAVARELQHLRHRAAGTAADPDVARVIDVDAVLADAHAGFRPVVAFPRPAPRPHDVAVRVELDHRRRGVTAQARRRAGGRSELARRQAPRPMHDPDVIPVVHGDARDLPHRPVVRQVPREGRVDAELRVAQFRDCRRVRASACPGGRRHRQHDCENEERADPHGHGKVSGWLCA